MNWEHPEGYIIRIKFNNGNVLERGGIFLFKHKDGGILWVESSYLDLWGGSPSLHEVIGPIIEKEVELKLVGKDRTAYIAYADDDEIRQDFDYLARERKTTFKQERKRVKKDLKDQIIL
ncbi:MAG: hypothetical protein ACQ9MH_20925 [Nitrospinales bacterium]